MKIIRPVSITSSGSFSRSSIGTFFDKDGAMQTVGSDIPRLDHDPVTHLPKGLLVESATTNYFPNGNTPVSGTVVSLVAGTYTMSFYGTGTVSLTGGYTGSKVGTGAFPTRSTLTFYASGDTTFTISGSVQYLQVELGSTATSYIPTSTGAITRAADVVTGSGLIYTDAVNTEYNEWNPATAYSVGDRVRVEDDKMVYENILAGTNSTAPSLAPSRWIPVYATNKWRAFDTKINTQTSRAESLTFILKPGNITGIGLLNTEASYVEISVVVPTEATPCVFSGAADLTNGNTIGSWYEYFFEPIQQLDSFIAGVDSALPNIPPFINAIVCVTLYYPANTAKVGNLVVGMVSDLGLTQYDSSIGIVDYSKKTTDDFGNINLVQRTYSKRLNVELQFRNEKVDSLAKMLAQYRAAPVVWIGMDNIYTSMIIYGYYRDWEISLSGPSHSTVRIQIEGMT